MAYEPLGGFTMTTFGPVATVTPNGIVAFEVELWLGQGWPFPGFGVKQGSEVLYAYGDWAETLQDFAVNRDGALAVIDELGWLEPGLGLGVAFVSAPGASWQPVLLAGGRPMPGTSGETFQDFGRLALGGSGEVSFWAQGSAGTEGVFVARQSSPPAPAWVPALSGPGLAALAGALVVTGALLSGLRGGAGRRPRGRSRDWARARPPRAASTTRAAGCAWSPPSPPRSRRSGARPWARPRTP